MRLTPSREDWIRIRRAEIEEATRRAYIELGRARPYDPDRPAFDAATYARRWG